MVRYVDTEKCPKCGRYNQPDYNITDHIPPKHEGELGFRKYYYCPCGVEFYVDTQISRSGVDKEFPVCKFEGEIGDMGCL